METLSVEASAVEWSDRELSLQDLSDLLWAANGINRPEVKKSTACAPALSNPPVQLILVSDSARFWMGPPQLRYEWGAIDTGIVSRNISLFCAATGFKTRPRASMDKEKIKSYAR